MLVSQRNSSAFEAFGVSTINTDLVPVKKKKFVRPDSILKIISIDALYESVVFFYPTLNRNQVNNWIWYN